jgi:phosphate transport system permease protein
MNRVAVRRSRSGDGSPPVLMTGDPAADRPHRRQRVDRTALNEGLGSAAASFALVWVVFTLAGISALFGLVVCWLIAFLTIYGALCRIRHGILIAKDRLATVGIWAGAIIAFIALAAVISYVFIKGFVAVFGGFPHFFVADMSQLGGNARVRDLGVGAAIVGTVEQVGIATVITVPLGVLTATYLASNDGPFARTVSAVVDAMTGAPAIIAGLFVYLLWVVPHGTSGKTGFAAALALAVMMLPVVTRAAQEVVAIVPGSYREAALALGAPEWRVLLRVVLPTARAGLMTAIILGVARIAGETAPVLFNAGGFASYNWNPFSGQQDDLPLRIYQLIFQPGLVPIQAAWGTSLVLIIVVLILFVLARRLGASKPGRRRFVPWAHTRRMVDVEP